MIQSLLNIFRKPVTVDYPKEPLERVKDTRGLIKYDSEHCIFCDKCEKVCPPNAIVFYQNIDGSKKYRYNPYLCIYCGECVRACPKPDEALWQSEEKALPATAQQRVNDDWFAWQEKSKASREAYKEAKKNTPKGESAPLE